MPEANRIEDDLASRELARLTSNQEKAKAAVEWLEYVNTNTKTKFDARFHALSIIRPLAAGTHVMVPVEPTQEMLMSGIDERHEQPTPEAWNLATINIYRAMITASQEQE